MSIMNNFPAGSGENNGLPLPNSFGPPAVWTSWINTYASDAADVFGQTINLSQTSISLSLSTTQISFGRYLLILDLAPNDTGTVIVWPGIDYPSYDSPVWLRSKDGHYFVQIHVISDSNGFAIELKCDDECSVGYIIDQIRVIDLAQFT